ncbi:DUF502 domain-containing protein [Pseudidiomarina sp.]|uniref:DUF502 domain-containing protein n=1 Tax=Pseudidiomarina sp. TaxID=2081707 RepID=UPI00299DEB66|nr:DUF502 domain-containing protein [Pseudidiomarina sp.]MDX1706579.1 DUF502 domain-containing protein [Pseudidiomarina sp.]
MKRALQYLLKGLAVLLPIALTIALVHWLLVTVEAWLRPLWIGLIGEDYYLPGLAFVSFLGIAVFIGFSTRWRIVSKFWALPGMLIERMPVLSNLYGTLTEAVDLMSGKSFADESVVLVTLPGDVRLIGIITKRSGLKGDRLSALLDEDHVAVLLPMSYNVGGYTIIVSRDCIQPLDMSPADAMQLTISAGLGKNKTIPKNKD